VARKKIVLAENPRVNAIHSRFFQIARMYDFAAKHGICSGKDAGQRPPMSGGCVTFFAEDPASEA
jgi:hypothetical protein